MIATQDGDRGGMQASDKIQFNAHALSFGEEMCSVVLYTSSHQLKVYLFQFSSAI